MRTCGICKEGSHDTGYLPLQAGYASITAQTRQIQSDYEAKLKQREIVQEVGNADTLTQALIDRLISKVYIFPGDRIEIAYEMQDVFGVKEGNGGVKL